MDSEARAARLPYGSQPPRGKATVRSTRTAAASTHGAGASAASSTSGTSVQPITSGSPPAASRGIASDSPLPHRRWGSTPAGREGAVRRSRTERRWKPASSALSRGPSGAARHLPAAARQGGECAAMSKTQLAARVAHAPCLAGPGVRRAGRWRGARAGGPGTVGCGSFGSRRCNAPRSRLDGGPCQRGLSPLCRMPYATPGARHACAPGSPDAHPAGAGASDAPADPAVFFSPQANTRPTHPRGRLGRGSKTPSPRRGVEEDYAPGRKGRVQLCVRRRLIRCGASVWMAARGVR